MSSDPIAPPVHGEILTGVQRRRRWSTTEKIRLVEESQQPGSSVSFVARRYGISPSLLMTGYTRNAIVHNGMLDPGVRLLSKPFTVADLARKLQAALEERRDRAVSTASE